MFDKYDGFDPTLLKYLSLITQLGLLMISSIVIFLLIGRWLDKLLETGNIFLILGIICGIAGGITSNYMILRKFYGNK
jgi:F0F1-type ATP synthase assembly protein I